MCGIVGLVHRDPRRPVKIELVRAMCDAIRHRGPDDEGLWASGGAGLGMRRLSIIDLAGGRQPIWNEDRSALIVFNGEIYNYRELESALVARGHRFRTRSDTETILHLWEEEGPACVARLRGMFAFAIWSERERALFLARDRFGIKPLYYVAAPWGLAFSSELKALVAAGLTARELDWPALDAFLQLGYVPAPATPFRDVRKLEPGHALVWRDGALTIRRYWDLPRHGAPDAVAAAGEVEREVLEWIDDSVAAHLVSDVPVAAFLSGGLDSSAVLASAALAGGAAPHAFTARYTGTGAAAADETSLARTLAERYGAPLTVVDIAPDVAAEFERVVYALDEPHADDSAIPTWALSRAVGSSFKVALTGIGGDELFAGYRRHLGLVAAAWYGGLPAPLRRAAGAAAAWLPEPAGGGLGVNRLKRFVRSGDGGGDAADRFLDIVSRLGDVERAGLYAPALRPVAAPLARERFRSLGGNGGSHRGLSAGLYLDLKTFLPDDILALSDRLSMAHGLEIRVPLVDHVLAERVFPLPARLKVGWGERKRLLKRALRSRLPQEHFTAPKRGFVGPTTAWLRNELKPMLTDELSPARLARLGYFDAGAVGRLVEDHLALRENREGILWALLCFSVWHRVYVEGAAAPAPPDATAIRAAPAAASRR